MKEVLNRKNFGKRTNKLEEEKLDCTTQNASDGMGLMVEMYKYMKKACRFHKSNKLDLLGMVAYCTIVFLFFFVRRHWFERAHKLHKYNDRLK